MVDPSTMSGVISTESSHNPYAIAIVKGKQLSRQARTKAEAIAVIKELERKNINYSVGIAQINKGNFKRYGVTGIQLLDPCLNLQISQKVLQDCHSRSNDIDKTLSCYYSGNFTRGFKKDYANTSYVERVYKKASNPRNIPDQVYVPALKNRKSYQSSQILVSNTVKIKKSDNNKTSEELIENINQKAKAQQVKKAKVISSPTHSCNYLKEFCDF